MTRTLCWLLLAAAVAAGCSGGAIEASGTIRDEVRPVSSFDRIVVRRGVDVQIVADPDAAASVIVHYDDNVIGEIVTEVNRNTLEIRLEAEVRLRGGGRRFVEVTVPRLNRIEATDGARIVGLGQVAALQVLASGGASVDLGSLEASAIDVDVSGGANTTVNATGIVQGDASGGARLLVVGRPSVVNVATSGGASVADG
ncbi:MAG TPA: DUF2807 domain-containing protein [Acidimicrobiia bacterium]|nr:DUF2807 domain-containing protein [Acidimicrobiia bacterium]